MNVRVRQAFTLLEMIVVLALIGLIAAVILPAVQRRMMSAERSSVELKFSSIKSALTEYRMEFGVFPSSKEGLRALIENPRPNDEHFKRAADKWPFVKPDVITDRAGVEFEYSCPPEKVKIKKGPYRYYLLRYLGNSQSEDDPQYVEDGE